MFMLNFLFGFNPRRVIRYCLKDVLPRLTLKRAINLIVLEWDLLFCREVVRAYPYELFIEPTNLCQLRCPLCPNILQKREKQIMSFEVFKYIIDTLGRYAFHIFLHNKGEPTLNKDVWRFIEYAKRKNVAVTMSTNLSYHMTEQEAERLLLSGLDTLVISMDGIHEDTYKKYRVGGNYNLVLQNIELLVRKKRALRQKRPLLEWQYIVFRHNENDISEAKKMVKELGLDCFALIKAVLPHGNRNNALREEWFPKDERFRIKKGYDIADNINGKCWYLWRTVVINSDGGISPCCYVADPTSDFGNIRNMKEKSFHDVWNNSRYRMARGLFNKSEDTRENITSENIVCMKCSVVMGRNDNG